MVIKRFSCRKILLLLVNTGLGQRAAKQLVAGEDPVLGVQQYGEKDLMLAAGQREAQKVAYGTGRAEGVARPQRFRKRAAGHLQHLSLIHISEPTRQAEIS